MNTKGEKRNPKVDAYVSRTKRWQAEIKKLRTIALNCGLTEELKWGVPCYTMQKSNIVLIHVFKEYCALLFFKGALIEPIVKAYILEAIEVEKAGLEVSYKKTSEFKMPEEFQTQLNKRPALKTAFAALTPGRQRGYLLYFSAAKQSKTREARIKKCIQRILDGKGLNDE